MTKTIKGSRFGDPALLKIPKSMRRKPMNGEELKVYHARQLKISQRERRKFERKSSFWRGATTSDRKALYRFGWSDVQINRLNETEIIYHIKARSLPEARFGGPRLLSASEQRILKGEGTMLFANNEKKGSTKTRNKTKTEDAGKVAVKTRTGVGSFIIELIMAGKTNNECREAVIEKFGPDAKAATSNHVPWYRAKLRRDGRNPPEPDREAKAKKTPAKKTPAKKSSAKKTPAKKSSAKKSSAKKSSAKKKTTGSEDSPAPGSGL